MGARAASGSWGGLGAAPRFAHCPRRGMPCARSAGLAALVGDCIKLRDRDGVLESKTFGRDGTDAWFRNVVLAGGSTCIPGVAQRLQNDLFIRVPKGSSPEVHAPPERKYSAWMGGSILGSLAVMDQMWISKEEYDENGPLIVHRKCLW